MKAIKVAVAFMLFAIPVFGVGCGGVDGEESLDDAQVSTDDPVATSTEELRRDRDDRDRDRDRDWDRDRDRHNRGWRCYAYNHCGGRGDGHGWSQWEARREAQEECRRHSQGWCRARCEVRCSPGGWH